MEEQATREAIAGCYPARPVSTRPQRTRTHSLSRPHSTPRLEANHPEHAPQTYAPISVVLPAFGKEGEEKGGKAKREKILADTVGARARQRTEHESGMAHSAQCAYDVPAPIDMAK